MNIAVLTISDRSSRGEREDRSGPLIREIVQGQGWQVVDFAIVPDDEEGIADALSAWCSAANVDLVLTTGGTGFSPRDQAPEATLRVVDRLAPGLTEAMRASSMKKTPHAMLSRAVAGISGRTLIVNLPGSPKAVQENLEVILPALPHAIALLSEDPGAEASHGKPHPLHADEGGG